MQIKGAMTILTKQAEFFGMSIEETIDFIDRSPMAHPVKVIQAYEVYMKDKGYVWSGVNFERWIKKENI